MSELSRRDFLKGSLAGAASLAMAGIGLSAVKNTAHAAGIYTPGTYSATADGMGTVTVTATFDENSITEILLDVSGETPSIGQAAKDELISQVMAAQSAEIDGVSSATITSTAVKTALKNCIAQAKGEAVNSGSVKPQVASDGAFILKDITADDVNASAVELDPITSFAKEVDVDVVVAGAGASGVIAAVRAAELGATVAVLQKEAVAVSQGNCSSAIIKSGSTEGGLKKWLTFATAVNCWRNNRKLLEAYIERSEEALKFVCEKSGITEETEWKNKYGVTKYQDTSAVYTGVWHDGTQSYDFGDEKVEVFAPWFGPKPGNYGSLVSGILKDAQEEYGDKLQVYFSTPIVQLVKDADGTIIGCVGKDLDGNYIKFNAKSVILATGAYENNATMVRRFCPDVEKFDKTAWSLWPTAASCTTSTRASCGTSRPTSSST